MPIKKYVGLSRASVFNRMGRLHLTMEGAHSQERQVFVQVVRTTCQTNAFRRMSVQGQNMFSNVKIWISKNWHVDHILCFVRSKKLSMCPFRRFTTIVRALNDNSSKSENSHLKHM